MMRDEQKPHILISAPNREGRFFAKQLLKRQIAVALMTNNNKELERLYRFKDNPILLLNTLNPETWAAPAFQVSLVVIFENSLALTWRYVQYCRTWTDNPIHLFSERFHSIAKRRELNIVPHLGIKECDSDRVDKYITDLLASVNIKPF